MFSNNSRIRKVVALIAFVIVVTLAGCGNDDNNEPTPTTTTIQVPLPSEACTEIDRREAQIEESARQAVVDIENPEDVDDAFEEIEKNRTDALAALEADRKACEDLFPTTDQS